MRNGLSSVWINLAVRKVLSVATAGINERRKNDAADIHGVAGAIREEEKHGGANTDDAKNAQPNAK